VIVSIDGQIVAPEQATVSIFDRGFLYGDGLFETFRTWDGVAVDAAEHLARLRASASALDLRLGGIDIAPALSAAGEGEQRIKIIVTRGPGGPGVRFGTLGPGRTIVIVEPLGELAETVTAAIVAHPVAPRAHAHKTLAYLDSLVAGELARVAGADEAIRLDVQGDVCEGATTNVFVVEGGRVITPARGMGALPGVTRAQVIALGGVREERVSVDRLRNADELFVTSAVRGVVGIERLDDDARSVGPVTKRLRTAHRDEMQRRAKQIVAERRDPR